MKKVAFFLIASAAFSLPALVNATVGCMDNSHHLAKSNDSKELHYVHCTCPCSQKLLLKRGGKCLTCKHYHKPKDWVMISEGKETLRVPQYRSPQQDDVSTLSPATKLAIQEFISKHNPEKKAQK